MSAVFHSRKNASPYGELATLGQPCTFLSWDRPEEEAALTPESDRSLERAQVTQALDFRAYNLARHQNCN